MAETAGRWDPTTKAQLRRIDQLENQARRRWSEWLSALADLTLPWVLSPRSAEQISAEPFPLPGALGRLLVEHGRYMLMTGMAHADYEVIRLRERYAPRHLARLVDAENHFRVVPEEALEALRGRELILAGEVEASVLAEIKRVAMRVLTGDLRRRQAEAAVQEVLQSAAARARNIVTTETTWAYNRGRLAQFRQAEVTHVMFRAVMDAVTSQQCRSRHGRIMAIDDPALPQNTPPLHGFCRSILSPVIAELEPGLMSEAWRFNWSGVAALPKGWSTR